jgi:hypothetical protein
MTPLDLDRELQLALTAEPSPEQTARLAAYWQSRSRADRRRRRIRQLSALAATLLACAAAAFWIAAHNAPPELTAQHQTPPAPKAPSATQPPTPDSPPSTTTENLAASNPPPPPPPEAGRAPTEYERAMFAVLTRTAVDSSTSRLAAELDAAIDQLAADSGPDAAQLAAAGDLARRGAERLLLQRLPRADEPHRVAVVHLLAVCGTQRSLPALLQAAGRPSLRGPALAAVERILGPSHLADAVRMSPNRDVRWQLLQRLLAADGAPALRGYLSLVSQSASRGEALAAAAAAPALPVDSLMDLLADDEKSVRLAAALVLGHVDGPRIAQSLIALASRGDPAPPEAWIALLACRDAAADRFLAQAAVQPRWLAQVNNARMFWARFTP